MDLSVIIPFYNEDQQVKLTVDTVLSILKPLNITYELILIDDGSSDQTWTNICQLSQSISSIYGIHFSRNFGKEAAICAGLDHVHGNCCILMDGDLQHPPTYIPTMLNLWKEGYEVVEGIKSERQKESAISRLFARSFYKIFHWLGGFELQNASDFKLLDRKVIDAWKSLNERTTFFRGLSAWLGFKRTTFPFEVAERTTGQSKWKLSHLIRLSSTAITSFSSRPLQIITILGILSIIGSFILMIDTLFNYLTNRAASGFTTVILLQLFLGGMIMLSLGLIGTYIGKIYNEIKGRPRYLISEIIQDGTTVSSEK